MSASTTSSLGIPSPTDPGLARLIGECVSAASTDHAAAIAAVVSAVALTSNVDVSLVVDGAAVAPHPDVVLVLAEQIDIVAATGPWLPGFVREALLAAEVRHRGGVHHTSPAMAFALTEFVAQLVEVPSESTVLDPACGGGAFLLAATSWFAGSRAGVVGRLRGMDVDPLAVATTVASLRLWAGGAPVEEASFVVGDGLDCAAQFDNVDIVIGNPPFQAQLRGATVRNHAARERLRTRWPEVGGYVDEAAAFLLAGVDAAGASGAVALVQPASFLAARDAAAVRQRLEKAAPLRGIWIDGERQFDAAVDTIAVVHAVGGAASTVTRATGVPPVALAPLEAAIDSVSWAPLLRTDDRPPLGDIAVGRRLSEVANITAGFRDHFYGLRGAVAENAFPLRLITSGLIDPLHERWGETSCRFDGDRWERPTVSIDAVDPAIRSWINDRLVPKLLVASQTKTIEVIVDPDGTRIPCTPVVTVEPTHEAPSLAHLAVALTSPVVSSLMLDAAAGSALSRDAMRVSATTLGQVPLPPNGEAWDAAATMVTSAFAANARPDLLEIAGLMNEAYGVADSASVTKWWRERLPRR